MAQIQKLVIPLQDFLDSLIARGVVPSGTTKGSCYGNNTTLQMIIQNGIFTDIPPGDPIPVADIDVPAAISTL